MGPSHETIVLDKHTNDPGLRNQVVGYLKNAERESEWFIHFPFELKERDPENIVVHYAFTLNGQEVVGRKDISVAPLPDEFVLYQNYPNPFNPMTTIDYAIPEAADVHIVIYDIMGREVKTLVNQFQEPGYRSIQWNSTNTIAGTMS